MKKHFGNFLLAGALLLLTCSFTQGPTSGITLTDATPVGGAYLTFAGKFGGNITQKEIAAHQDLGVDGCARGSRIYQFTIDITKGGKTTTLNATTNVLNKDMLARLKGLAPGDTFEFRETKAYLPNGKDKVDVHSKKFVVV